MSISTAEANGHWRVMYRYTPGIGLQELPTLGGDESETKGINASGQITGYSQALDGRERVFRYTDSSGIQNLSGTAGGTGRVINDRGWVAGTQSGHALLFRDEGNVDLGPGRAFGLNNAGDVVGETYIVPGHPTAFVYRDGQMTILGDDVFANPILTDISESGQAVGSGYVVDFTGVHSKALFWSDTTGLVDLNAYLRENTGWELWSANGINESGQIIGFGSGGAFRLDPIPEPSTWALMLLGGGVALLFNRWKRERKALPTRTPELRRRALTTILAIAAAALWSNTVMAQGVQAWAVSLESGGPLAADDLGNVHVAGHASNGTNQDFVTLKLDGAGKLLWSRHFDRNRGDDTPAAMAINKFGAVFVTGNSGVGPGYRRTVSTVKYSRGGNLRWFATYKPNGPTAQVHSIAPDAFGDIYITGYSQTTNAFEDYEFFTVKYNRTTGHAIWTNRINQMGSDHALAGMGLDDAGNVYVAGGHNFRDEEDNVKVVIIKYHRDGQTFWKKRFDAPSYADAMTVDKLGNIYVTGNRETIKVDTAGNLCWVQPFPGAAAGAVTVDRSGSVIVSGQDDSFSEPSARTVKYDGNGNVVWTRTARTGEDNYPVGLVVDESQNIYLTYRWARWDTSSFGQTLLCYSPRGTEAWSSGRWTWPGVSPAGPAVNAGGQVFVGWMYSFDSALELAKYTQPYAPPLSIHSNGQTLVLSWPALATNVVLEASKDLATALNWQSLTNRPAMVGGKNLVKIRVESEAQFFRLRAQ